MKVTLRTKPMTKGRKSLYLDFYPPIKHPETGKLTRREFLKLYTYNRPKNPFEQLHNEETLSLAQAIRADRQLSLQAEKYGFLSLKMKEASFLEFFEELAKKRTGSNRQNWLSALKHLETFSRGNLKCKDISVKFCEDYREYLLKAPSRGNKEVSLSKNSAVSYFTKFRTALKEAFKKRFFDENINALIEGIEPEETDREFVTIMELEKLAETPCKNPIMKTAAIFSALTGLRFSDIQALTWERVQFSEENGYFIKFRQKKTDKIETHPISELAFSLLGDRRGNSEPLFPGLKYSAHQNTYLREWIKKAGISKNITFHNFRHTYANLQFSGGTDIYTISKLLGHSHLKTTEIYTKGDYGKKRKAADSIKINLNNNHKS